MADNPTLTVLERAATALERIADALERAAEPVRYEAMEQATRSTAAVVQPLAPVDDVVETGAADVVATDPDPEITREAVLDLLKAFATKHGREDAQRIMAEACDGANILPKVRDDQLADLYEALIEADKGMAA